MTSKTLNLRTATYVRENTVKMSIKLNLESQLTVIGVLKSVLFLLVPCCTGVKVG